MRSNSVFAISKQSYRMARRRQVPLPSDARRPFVADRRKKEMLRVLLYVTLLAGLFAGAVLWAGNAVGAFEPMTIPAHTPGASTETTKPEKPHKNHHHRAKKH
jgi:hypothetical protein